MRGECITAITKAAGRDLTAPELRDIESRILKATRMNAREDRQAQAAMSPAQRVQAAAERVARELTAERERAIANVARQVIAHDRNLQFVQKYGPKVGGYMNALRRIMGDNLDKSTNVRSLEQRRNGIVRDAMRNMQDIADYTNKYLGIWTNKETQANIVKELHGQDSGDAHAKYLADRWTETAESLRQQYNGAGGNIGKLEGWAAPQSHSQFKVYKAGLDKWLDYLMPRLNREMYVRADGSLMGDAEVRAAMGTAFDSITTNGANSIEPGKITGSSMKNRGQDERVIHFKDGQSWSEYNATFGDKSLLEAMIGHIGQMGKQIATLEAFGPNAESGFKTLLDMAYQRDKMARSKTAGAIDKDRHVTQTQFNTSSGKIGAMADPVLARRFDIAKALIILPRLGSATLSAITDGANVRMIARAWNIPAFQMWTNTLKAWTSGDFRQTMRANGVGVESISHSISRFGEDTFGHGLPAVLANTLFKVSGLNFIDSVRRTATGAMLMQRMGDLVSNHETMVSLHENDRAMLESRGVTENTFAIWKQAQLSDGMLTPNGVGSIEGLHPTLRRDALQHLIGVVHMDEGTAVPMMKDWARASVSAKLGAPVRGTIGGELVNSILQFKSFPISMISNHWQRMQSMPTPAGKAMYAAELAVSATILGALSVQMKSLASGYNPQDMTDPKFAARAFIQGGATGILGDTILNAMVSPNKEHLTDQLGPIIGELGNLYDLGRAGIDVARAKPGEMQQKENQAYDAALRFGKQNTPFANLWYAKAAVNRLFFDRLSDYFSPGYSQRAIARSQKDYNNTPWWAPSTAAAPNQLLSTRGISSPQVPNINTATGVR